MTTTRVIRRIGALAVAMCAFEPVSAADYYSRLANDPAGSSSLSGTGSSAGWATSEGGARVASGITAGNRYFACNDNSAYYIRTPTSSWTMPANSSLTVQEDCYQMLAVICDVVNTIPSDPPWRCGQVGENRLVVRSPAATCRMRRTNDFK